MNKIFYQFRDTDDEDRHHFMYLNPIDSEDSTHERVDIYNSPGDASPYTVDELEDSFGGQLNTFKLEFIYD